MRRFKTIRLRALWAGFVFVALHIASQAGAQDTLIRQRLIEGSATAQLLQPPSVGDRLRLPLPDDSVATLVTGRCEITAASRFTITGRIEGSPAGSFVLAVDDGHLAGAYWLGDGRVMDMRSSPDDPAQLRVSEITPDGCGECGTTAAHLIQPPLHHFPANENPPFLASMCPPVIDVMILYTDLARDMLGSDQAMRALAAASVASTNLCYENSAVPQRLRLVHVERVAGTETGDYGLELLRLLSPNDSHYDVAQSLRDRHGADLVSLFVGTVTGSCGVAFTMGSPSPAFESSGFSVVQQNCAVANLSFAHELAHNMGCAHQRGDGSVGSFPFSHGHRFVGQSGTQWRTVMAGSSGFRVPHFSNPEVAYDGVPTGVSLDEPLPSHNALSLQQTAAIVADFRPAHTNDCNRNGRDDACDIQLAFSSDANTNGIPDECDAPACAGDDDLTVMPPDLASHDRFGGSLSLAGTRMVVGSEHDDDAGSFSGSAYVFRREGERWVTEDKLRAADANAFDRFGHAVAISPDEAWIVIGAYREGDILSDTGAIYFFQRAHGMWTQTQRILNPDPSQADWFGWTVGFSREGKGLRAVVGSPFDDEFVQDGGAVYAYRLEGSTWVLEQKMTSASPSIGARMGYALRTSSQSRIIAGAPFEDGVAMDTGGAEIFHHDGRRWTSEGCLAAPSAAAHDRFGISVAISGRHAIVGASGDDERGDRAGAAHSFSRHDEPGGARWIHTGTLFAPDAAAQASFGVSAAMQTDLAIIGATFSESGGAISGAAYTFLREGETWVPRAKFNPRDAASSDGLGAVVAMSADASHGAVAAIFDDGQGTVDGGSVRIFPASLDQPDCNGNGLPDQCDIVSGSSPDADSNSHPDECEPIRACPMDFDGNGAVDIVDLLDVINAWGACGAWPNPCLADTSPRPVGDGEVTVDDLLAVINAWGICPEVE